MSELYFHEKQKEAERKRRIEYAEKYGLKDPFVDELELWKTNPALAKTRIAKIRLGDAFEEMRRIAEHYIEYCKYIPEEDSEAHAELVDAFSKAMHDEVNDIKDKIRKFRYNE